MSSVNGHRKRCFRKQLLIPLCPFYSYKEAASLKEALFKVPPSNSQFEHSTIKIFMKIEMEYLLHSNFLHFNLQTNSWILVLGFRIWDLRSEPNSDKNYWFLGNFWKALEKASSKPNPTGFGKIAIRGSNSELPWNWSTRRKEEQNLHCKLFDSKCSKWFRMRQSMSAEWLSIIMVDDHPPKQFIIPSWLCSQSKKQDASISWRVSSGD